MSRPEQFDALAAERAASHGLAWKAQRVRRQRGGAVLPRGQDQGGRRLLRDRRSWHLPGVAAVRTVSRHAEPECIRGEPAELSGFMNARSRVAGSIK